MDQLKSYADDRLISGCIHCGGPEETRDHVPSRIFLDSPFPENLPVVGSCWPCNNGFSKDEEYLACLIESILAGTTDPTRIRREKIADILRRAPALRARIEAAKSIKQGQTYFDIEQERVIKVLLKLARGHAAFELSQLCRGVPDRLWCSPLSFMTKDQQDSFNACHFVQMFGEVGSRSLQRLLVTQLTLKSDNGETSNYSLLVNDWVDVQDGYYRYLALDDCGAVRIKIVIAEYLACEVTWVL